MSAGEAATGETMTGEDWTLAQFSDTIHRGGVGLWAWSPERRLARLDGLCRAFWGTTEAVVPIDALFARVNAEDRDGMMHEWMASATDPQPYSFDFRIGEGAQARWISARGIGGNAGRVGEWLHAIFLDVTERRRAEEAERLLTAELAHRVSNMFTVARALTAIVARDATSAPTFAEDLSRRFGILHEATVLATRSHRLDQGDVRLGDLADRILAPYRDGADIALAIADDAVAAPDRVNDYAMIFHELATNSAKYGALSGGGSLRLRGDVADGHLRLTWDESSARAAAPKADGTGFGSRLLRQTIERSLGGRFERTIDADGLHFAMTVPVG
ncbi:HWE histidine kinase domain-containing protein [Methylobacterium sp. 17Sr1-1]|uniref:HWE histidine kinase domain-containing protein n=1 Tax=Methylobacterium sp. 17Sr1-1 TaxID=2202826 RepID=UPI000D6F6671|nr:HWE histidine kinase domain-containing protein [Methylobacterium sp. 17Sr1-1]AWN52268.1 histidine kinase [Methylobacterium sp. 17Sr1-1]